MSNQNLLIASSKGSSGGSGPSGPTDVGFNYVAALFHGDGTNNTANNTSVATSSNVLSKGGTLAEGSFTPYGSAWSNYFSGTSYITAAASSAFTFGSGAFTVECWINQSTTNSNGASVVDFRTTSSNGWYLDIDASNHVYFHDANANKTLTSTATIVNGTWNHIAVVRDGSGNLVIYLNGTAVITSTDTTNFSTTLPLQIAHDISGSTTYTYCFTGYISNLRVVLGTAVYTSSFTPSTLALTAISGTTLLTCQSNRFRDVSTNAMALTLGGGVAPTVVRFSPFGDNGTAYSTSAYGGSLWLDGTSGYLSTPASTNYQFAGDFTVEAWVYPTTLSFTIVGYWTYGAATSCSFILQTNGSGVPTFSYGIGSSNAGLTAASTKVTLNAWNHVAVVRQGTSVHFYVNGVQDTGTFTLSGSLNNATQPLTLGANINTLGGTAQNFLSGYMSDVRIVNGTALYTSSFTPNTASLTSVTNTTLLYNAQSGGSIGVYDSAMQQNVQTLNNVQISNAQSKFGSGSVYFNGSTSAYSYLRIPYYEVPVWGSRDWTAECWVYTTSAITGGIISPGSSSTYRPFSIELTAGKLIVVCSTSGSTWAVNFTSASAIPTNAWVHIAVTSKAGVVTGYVNGTSIGSGTYTGSLMAQGTNPLVVGCNGSPDGGTIVPFTGYISDVRITYGVARYTANFSVPTAAYPNNLAGDPYFNNVICLIHGTGQNAYANNAYVATMPTASLSLTRAGTLAEGSFTPYGSNWSNFLSSTSTASYLSYGASTSAGMANQTFTIEAWVMFETLPTSTGSNGEFNIWQKGRSGTSNYELGFSLILNASGTAYQLMVQVSNNGSNIVSVNSPNLTNFGVGQWNHVAITQVGGSGVVNYWFNGVNIGSSNHGITNMYVGTAAAAIGNNNAGGNAVWQGYISNLRVVFGSQVYTSTFTPPTAPLTAITGTNLLTCQSSSFTDTSANNWALTPNGPIQVSRFNPFGDKATPYSTATYGGSCYFAGSGSNLSYAANPIFGFGTGAFTIECWLYQTAYNSNNCDIIDLRAAVGQTAMSIGIDSTGHLYYYDGPANVQTTATVVMALNAWYHVAVSRDAFGVWRAYVNGTQVITTTGADNLGSSQPILIGQAVNGTSYGFVGYISDMRITNGRALYTQAFAPSTTPMTQPIGTNFLYKAQGAAVYDNAMQQNAITLGTAAIGTSQYKFGSASIFVSSSSTDTTSMVQVLASQMPVWGTSNFTIEGWFYVSSTSANSNGLFGQRSTYSNYTPIMAVIENGVLNTYAATGTSSWAFTINAGTVTTGAWFHYALVRNGSTFTVYVNGVSKGTGTTAGALLASSAPFTIGASAATIGSGNYSLPGNVDDFRITFGSARYTSNFTPPTTAFPDQ